MNYFEIFGLEQTLDIDLGALTQRYQSIQKSVHPDKFAHASSQEQLLAAKKSTLVNDAYQTLKNPLKRAQYMLEIRGVDMPNEQASFSDNTFLMRQMELREMLAEVKFANDVDTALFEANQVLDLEFQQLFQTMQTAINENSVESNQQATELLRKLKFYQKLQVELDRLEDQLFDD